MFTKSAKVLISIKAFDPALIRRLMDINYYSHVPFKDRHEIENLIIVSQSNYNYFRLVDKYHI